MEPPILCGNESLLGVIDLLIQNKKMVSSKTRVTVTTCVTSSVTTSVTTLAFKDL